MKLNKRLERYLRMDMNLAAFHLLAVVPQSHEDAAVLLVPRDMSKDKYLNMRCRGGSCWYGTIDQMLQDCIDRGYIGRIHAILLKHRYDRFRRKSA